MDPVLLLITFVVGLLSGLISAVPVGPINTTIFNEGGQRGFWWAFMIGLGATVMEFIYCALAFTGFSSLLQSRWVVTGLQGISVILLLYLGIKYLRLHDVPRMGRTARLLEEKLHPHTAFMTGFLRVLANPGVFIFWVAMSSVFVAHGWIDSSLAGKGVCVGGVSTGVLVWFIALSYIATHAHRQLSTRSLVRVSQISGIVLLCVAVGLVVRLVLQFSRS
jgi:threonine/homoserine/homoserine lactone efflux protein